MKELHISKNNPTPIPSVCKIKIKHKQTPGRYIGKVSHKTQIKQRHLYCLKDSQRKFSRCQIKVVRNRQKRIQWTVRWQQTATSVMSVLNTQNIYSNPRMLGIRVVTWQSTSWKDGEAVRLLKRKAQHCLCFGAPWMRAECCHIGAFLP